jgi:hypothetical protein
MEQGESQEGHTKKTLSQYIKPISQVWVQTGDFHIIFTLGCFPQILDKPYG